MKAQAAMGKSDYPAAGQFLSMVTNKKAEFYYTQLAQLYHLQQDYKNVQATYIDAAKSYPMWSEAQLMAGAQSANNKDYALSEYFLLRAAEQLPDDPRPLYYLGVVSYESGDYQEAEAYFSDAVKLGIDGELAGYTAWYQQEMGGNSQ
jgi:tetratricopeptide (TPR) repeat protein